MATFRSRGHTVFREGDPAVPDIAAEKRGAAPKDRDARDGAAGMVLDGPLAAGLREHAARRGLDAREVLEEAVRAYLANRAGRKRHHSRSSRPDNPGEDAEVG